MKKFISISSLLILLVLLSSHEFWMQPQKFQFNKVEVAKIDFMVGENFEGERWSLKRHRIERLEQHTLKGVIKIATPTDTTKRPALDVTLATEGTHLLVMQSNNAYLALNAEEFNAYLKEDGIEDILELRTKTNTLTKDSREHYQRNTKLLLQCGALADDTYKINAGLPVEIIPVSNPYSAKVGDELQFKVLFENKPLGFSLVKVWHKAEGKTFLQNIYTDKDGFVTTRISGKGSWMLSCVKMVASKKPEADWQSYWGSLVFGIEK
jgi:uncharacterized GH25 family protein